MTSLSSAASSFKPSIPFSTFPRPEVVQRENINQPRHLVCRAKASRNGEPETQDVVIESTRNKMWCNTNRLTFLAKRRGEATL